jgi:transposase
VSARTWGKSDPIDALAVARAVLREPDLPVACLDAVSWELKLLVDRREDLVGQRVAVTNRLLARLHQVDPEQPQPTRLQRVRPRQALNDYLIEQPGLMAELAREELADIARFSDNIDALTTRIVDRVRELNSCRRCPDARN